MAPLVLTEDGIYRASTQYRLWSFTPETLASLRETNSRAAAELLSSDRSSDGAEKGDHAPSEAVDNSSGGRTINASDEIALVTHYTRRLLRIALENLGLPTQVAATGAIYLKRFYLSHSPATYPPQSIMPTCLFLATKTEHHYVPLSAFTKKWGLQLQPGDVIREEGIVTQALRFCFDVKHPFRGLRGALMELHAIADGKGANAPSSKWESSKQAQDEMLALPSLNGESEKDIKGSTIRASPRQAKARAFQAHDRAKEILSSSALLSDACFLYTPAQMMFAALLLADEPLALFYLSTKLSDRQDPQPVNGTDTVGSFSTKIMATVRKCAALFSATPTTPDDETIESIEQKLEEHRSASADMHRGSKRNGEEANNDTTTELAVEKSVKKRKLHDSGSKSPFGGPLTDSATSLGGSET